MLQTVSFRSSEPALRDVSTRLGFCELPAWGCGRKMVICVEGRNIQWQGTPIYQIARLVRTVFATIRDSLPQSS